MSGAVVSLVDSAGGTIRSTLTDALGRYSISLAGAASELKIVRIGFRPLRRRVPAGGSERRLDLRMEPLPPILDTVRTLVSTSCQNSDDGRTILAIWDQARAALLASDVATAANPPDVKTVRYERRMDPATDRVLQQRMTFGTDLGRRFGTGPAASELYANGYRRREGNHAIFVAPDARVLTDELFLRAHCLVLQRGQGARAGQVGLHFTPRPELTRPGRVDVEGTVWLDASISRLLELAYRYTEPGRSLSEGSGWIEFETLPTGIVFIQAWKIALPEVAAIRISGSMAAMTGEPRVASVSETGGFVLTAAWPDGRTWAGRVGAIRGHVTEQGTRAPVVGAELSLGESGSTWTDDGGNYTLAPLPPGRYEVRVIDSTWNYFAQRRTVDRDILVARDTIVVNFEVPSHESLIDQVCKKSKRRPLLLGAVTDGTSDRPLDMAVRIASARWAVNAAVDQTGHFFLCGAPDGGQVRASLLYRGVAVADTTLVIPRSSALVRVFSWSIGRSVFAQARRGDGGVLTGRVAGSAGPASGIHVTLPASGDTATTGPDGVFRFVGLRAQPCVVVLARGSTRLLTDTVAIRKNEETIRRFIIPESLHHNP